MAKIYRVPFVFAVWTANKKVNSDFKDEFNSAHELGLNEVKNISQTEQTNYPGVDIAGYSGQNISFELNQQKRAGMNKFPELVRKLEPAVSGK